jgi:hypothetical protein
MGGGGFAEDRLTASLYKLEMRKAQKEKAGRLHKNKYVVPQQCLRTSDRKFPIEIEV